MDLEQLTNKLSSWFEKGREALTKLAERSEKQYSDSLAPIIEQIKAQTSTYQTYSDQEILSASRELKIEIQSDYQEIFQRNLSDEKKQEAVQQILEDYLPDAYALVQTAIIRSELPSNKGGLITELTNQQLKGSRALADNIIDMKTGEGKTLTALLPAYLRSLIGEGVHIHTVNEYLAQRDYQQASTIFEKLGVNVGITLSNEAFAEHRKDDPRVTSLRHQIATLAKEQFLPGMAKQAAQFVEQRYATQPVEVRQRIFQDVVNHEFKKHVEEHVQRYLPSINHEDKKRAYVADITFGYHGEFAFDFLRDNRKTNLEEMVNPGNRRNTAIIDEIDNILIDQGSTPHVLSGKTEKIYSDALMHKIHRGVQKVRAEQHKRITTVEDKLQKTAQDITNEQKEIIAKYAITHQVPEQQLYQQLQTPGTQTQLKRELRLVEEASSTALGENLFLLRHLTNNSEVFSQLFNQYKVHYLRFANQEKVDREALFEGLNYVVEGKSIRFTEKGLDALYELGLQPTTQLVIDADHVMAQIGEDRKPDMSDFKDYIDHLQQKYVLDEATLLCQLQRNWNGNSPSIRTEVQGEDNPGLFKLINTFMEAHEFFQEGKDYVIHEDKVVLIDQRTGRPAPSRRYSKGLHEALEAINQVEINNPNRTTGNISLQKFFQLYENMTGLSGSVASVSEELEKTYGTPTKIIETSKPIIRNDQGLHFYSTSKAKSNAIIKESLEMHQAGRPVLIGVDSIAQAEAYAQMLIKRSGAENVQLITAQSALSDGYEEAELVKKAGESGKITIATNMAGRGTDIKLSQEARAAGGLHVMLTYIPDSERSTTQFIGRAGRLGDPGSSAIYGSVEDEMFSQVQGSLKQKMLAALNVADDDENACGDPLLRKAYERMIARNYIRPIEGNRAAAREYTLKLDDITAVIREKYLSLRNTLIRGADLTGELSESMQGINFKEERAETYLAAGQEANYINQMPSFIKKGINQGLSEQALHIIDREWTTILNDLEDVREAVSLSGYAQQKTEVAYFNAAMDMYEQLQSTLVDGLSQELIQMKKMRETTTRAINFT
jgi:preprotein translocase subunit SecA